MRRLMLQAIKDVQAGRAPVMTTADPAANPLEGMVVVSETVPVATDNRAIWRDFRAARAGRTPAAAK